MEISQSMLHVCLVLLKLFEPGTVGPGRMREAPQYPFLTYSFLLKQLTKHSFNGLPERNN
ncbi:hypothetical protein [Paenibacillus sp. P13VS]|uniref:hypothetical protein n=1 Tax=Paenibacillus sp. P13VS TaxID=2697367 RepID=UPI001D121F47|nr:hypothetical protein [Paenibacillus sp. P13VS]